MNWLNANALRAQRNRLPPLLGCLILSCVVPVIFCQTQNGSPGDDQANAIGSGDIILRQSKIRWAQHDKERRQLSEPTFKVRQDMIQRRHKEGLHKSSKAQLKRKKHLRDHKKFHKDSEITVKDVHKNPINLLQSEKKYFDYFPIEDANKKLVPLKDEDTYVVLLLNDTMIKEKVLKSSEKPVKDRKGKRSKRSAPDQQLYAQSNFHYVLAPEQRSRAYDDQYYSQGTRNDPWNNQYTRPLNGFYLPIPKPFVPAAVPHIKFPIPGIYYNAISPSGGHPVLTTNRNSVVTRFGAEDDRVIWEIKYTGGAGTGRQTTSSSSSAASPNSINGGQQPRPPTTRRPDVTSARRTPPPLIHAENRGKRTTTAPSRDFSGNNIPQQTDASRPTAAQSPRQAEPTRCVWAIVSCCSRNDLTVRYNCFEQIGCHGAFWDYNPCADNLQNAALSDAEKYFQR